MSPFRIAFKVVVGILGLLLAMSVLVYGYGAFGGRFPQELTTRFISNFSLELFNVPEPAALALLGTALAGLAFSRRRKT